MIIVVNSRSAPKTDWDRNEDPPGMVAQLVQSAGVPIDRYSFETIGLMKDRQEIYAWRREIQILRARLAGATEAEAEAKVTLPKLTLHTIDISFDAIKDPAERERLMNMPTTFVLPANDVDLLRAAAGRLLRESDDYQDLLREWNGSPSKAGGSGN